MNTNVNLKKLGNQLMFDIKDDELVLLEKDFKIFLDQIQLLNTIDTTNVEPMIYPLDDITTFLRNDEDTHMLDRELILDNAKRKENGYFVIPKVVK